MTGKSKVYQPAGYVNDILMEIFTHADTLKSKVIF